MQSHHLLGRGEEEEIRRLKIPSATIFWRGPLSFAGAAGQFGGGLYVIATQDNRPVYVGQTAGFRSRFLTRMELLRQAGCDLVRRRVFLGAILLPPGGGKNGRLRLDLESVLIRAYLKRGVKLANRSSVREFITGPKDTLVVNQGILPPLLPGRVELRRNERFELELPAVTRQASWQI